MTKDYAVFRTEELTILGHKVKVITEIFSDDYLDSHRFESRCLRCCFVKDKNICKFIKCNSPRGDVATHFELIND